MLLKQQESGLGIPQNFFEDLPIRDTGLGVLTRERQDKSSNNLSHLLAAETGQTETLEGTVSINELFNDHIMIGVARLATTHEW